jgi:hypothetical protein
VPAPLFGARPTPGERWWSSTAASDYGGWFKWSNGQMAPKVWHYQRLR